MNSRGLARPRRRTAAVALATAALLAGAALAGCGSSSDDASGSNASASAATDTFPVKVESRYGTATIAAEPKRVAVVGLMEQDALLALGVVPVATTEWFGEYPGAVWPWAQDELGTAKAPTVLPSTDGIQFEKVAAAKPDLIIGMYSGMTKEDYTKLSKIAPTVAQPKGSSIDYAVSWQEITETVGQSVGQSAKAETLVTDTEALIAEAAAANPAFKGKTGLVATPYEGFYVYGSKDPRGLLMQELGFVMPAGLDEVTGKEFGANLSKERTDLLDVDALVWIIEKTAADTKKINDNALYAGLDVAKEKRDVYVSQEDNKAYYGATSFISVLSIPSLLDGLVPQLAAAVDGDPGTAIPAVTPSATPKAS